MSTLATCLLCLLVTIGLRSTNVAASNLICYQGAAGMVVTDAEIRELQKYVALNRDYIFLPFGVETMGPWGSDAKILYKHLSSRSLTNFTSTPTTNPAGILDCIDKTQQLRFYTHGYNATNNGPAITSVISAYLQLNATNVLLLDWVEESKASTNLEYPAVVIRSMKVASDFAKALLFFIQNGVSVSLIYLAGHSVGAHVMGMAAEQVKNDGYTLPWISGLDPAGPFYNFPLGFISLDDSQAKYVQVLHTNPGAFGIDRSIGDADFWANCGNGGVQPGCDTGAFGFLNDDDLCSHNVAWMIYSEAVLCPDCFPAALATSCADWKSQTNPTVINYYGDDADTSKLGNFYFSTNPNSPYSKGQDGVTAN